MAAADAGKTPPAHGVQFVNKNNGRRIFLSLLKQIAHARRTDADEHFHKLRSRRAEKSHARFPRYGFGQQGFARAWRAVKQHAFGQFAA